MSYVTKLGAYGLTVAAAFAVALAVLVSVSSTPTAEAANVPLAENVGAATAAPGDTVQIAVDGALAQLSITGTADGVGGSFVANGGQSINCSDNSSCDKRRDTATPPAHVDDEITVDLKIDADSGEGYILVSVQGIGTATSTAQVTKVINVSKGTLVGSLELKHDTPGDKTIADDGTANLTATVKNASTPSGLLTGQAVTIITTHGTVGCAATAGTASAGSTQTCTVTTDADGIVDVLLTGGGVEGIATVTATLGTRTSSVDVTLFGDAKNLTAEPQQGSVEIGGSVFIVLTVTDAAGNPVSGQVIEPLSSKEVVGPGDDAVPVVTSQDATDGDTSDGTGYNVDYIASKSADSLPACGDDKDPVTDSGATPPTTEDFAANGTNAAGKCVVHVTAPEAEGTQKAATRGEHTLNFQISASIKASAVIEVAGKPASITTDAPEYVDPASVTTITVSVWDDEDVLVGITEVTVRKVGGDGLIEDQGEGNSEMTSNGQSKFTFIAPSTTGSSEILISAGDVNHRVTVNIGEAMVEPDPPVDEHEGEPTLTVQGSLGLFSGGSVDELAHAAEHECPGGATIYVQEADGSWGSPYVTDAAIDLVNMTFSARFPDGLAANTLVAITRCEADSMDGEGAMGG